MLVTLFHECGCGCVCRYKRTHLCTVELHYHDQPWTAILWRLNLKVTAVVKATLSCLKQIGYLVFSHSVLFGNIRCELTLARDIVHVEGICRCSVR